MKEGYWLNYNNGKEFEIDEHEQWIRTPGNAKKLGVPANVIAMFGKFKPAIDRDKFLLFVMKNAPVIRARGHGSVISFEYNSRDRQAPMDSILVLAEKFAGPLSQLYIVNFATKETTQMSFQEFDRIMNSQGAEAVMRAASMRRFSMKNSIVRELLKISKEILR
jgi:hypothetical protein